MYFPYNKKLTSAARNLRRNMTPEEKKLWYQFLTKYPVRFMRQRIIVNYILDFYCAKCKLCIEVDGNQHLSYHAKGQDAARTQFLNQCGITVIRFTNDEVNNSFDQVCKQIEAQVTVLLSSSPNQENNPS